MSRIKNMAKPEAVPANMQQIFDELMELIDPVCEKHLNEEYASMARKLTAALCRKRPSPLLSGKANSWAAGIMHAIGFVNFLFDRSQTPHVTAPNLCSYFGTSQSTGVGKSKQIRDLLNIAYFDPTWTLPSRMDTNPMAWMISVNGLIMDARCAPLHIQQEAFERGMIPYIPKRNGMSA